MLFCSYNSSKINKTIQLSTGLQFRLCFSCTADWNTANAQCGQLAPGATLASIDSAFVNGEIQGIVSSCNNTYIGLQKNDNNNWVWVNGDASSYRNWANGYPTTNTNSARVVMSTSDGKWVNQDCANPSCYICLTIM